ncbi:MAG TPA: prolipoprotein diacylglyceryl transferase [Candidatus Aminicenantes bacterium]|nr:prolipoprotein diacylglyceryl transferase [Candidatus Aminicenantes bacterium]
MFIHNINPVLITIGPLEIRYYGLMYALAIVISYFFLEKFRKQGDLPLQKNEVSDFIFWIFLGTIIGARLGIVFFYHPLFYLQNPLEIFMIWHGGMSFHGGLIGAIIIASIYCKQKKLDLLKIADLMVIPFALALFFGRIGNFLNNELWGKPTSLPWGVKFQGAEEFRHPSQIYEALKNLFIFGVLYSLKRKNLPRGSLFFSFLLLYGILRFLVEFVREPSWVFYSLSTGQILSIPLVIIGIIGLIKTSKNRH